MIFHYLDKINEFWYKPQYTPPIYIGVGMVDTNSIKQLIDNS
jgi:hypothetical protein